MNNRALSLIVGFVLTAFIGVITYIIFNESEPGSTLQRIALLAGGDFFPWGWIQNLTFFLFFYGIAEIYILNREFNREISSLSKGLLPEKDNWVLSPADVMELKLKIIEKEQKGKYFLTDLIKKACVKYRSGKSTSEALEVVSASVRIHQAKCESAQSIIRYVAWAIPSVGFIGTVIGIAASLGIADQASSPEGIAKVTGLLNVAFDTTLIALLLSLVLMFSFHRLTEKVEVFHSDVEHYVIENLINRIYHS